MYIHHHILSILPRVFLAGVHFCLKKEYRLLNIENNRKTRYNLVQII